MAVGKNESPGVAPRVSFMASPSTKAKGQVAAGKTTGRVLRHLKRHGGAHGRYEVDRRSPWPSRNTAHPCSRRWRSTGHSAGECRRLTRAPTALPWAQAVRVA